MVDITHKYNSLRTAVATAVLKVSKAETIQAIVEKKVPKGDVFEMAKTAGLFAVKRTSDMIPDCHPLPVEYTAVRYRIEGFEIHIELEVHTIYKTGVEVEAMHGVSVVALTMYDMLKPIDKQIEIQNIRLLEKTGGKSGFKITLPENFSSSIIVYSDAVKVGKKQDTAGQAVLTKLQKLGIENADYQIIGQENDLLNDTLQTQIAKGTKLVIVVGGTGIGAQDNSPEIVKQLIDFEIPGIAEAARTYGQERTSLAMLSRSVAGIKDKTLLLALPGSTQGARESMDALFPSLLHIFRSLK
jgi:molybdenum cofactor biosynthesis protein MoaC